jgi:hypothetical protein
LQQQRLQQVQGAPFVSLSPHHHPVIPVLQGAQQHYRCQTAAAAGDDAAATGCAPTEHHSLPVAMRSQRDPQLLAAVYTVLLLAGHAAAQPNAAGYTPGSKAFTSQDAVDKSAPIDVELIFSGADGRAHQATRCATLCSCAAVGIPEAAD